MKSKYLKSATKVFLAVFLLSTFYFLFSVRIFAADASALIDLNSYPWSNAKTPASFVAILYQVSLGLAAAAALGAMLYGAILYSVSGGNASRQDEGRKWITGAIWGVVLLLGASIILYTINPGLVRLTDPTLGKLNIPEKSSSRTAPENLQTTQQVDQLFTETKDIANQLAGANIGFSNKADCRGFSAQTTLEELRDGGTATICSPSCFCNYQAPVNPDLLQALNRLNGAFGAQNIGLVVTSITTGVHGQNSLHYKGEAVDISVLKSKQTEVKSFLESQGLHAICEKGSSCAPCGQADHIHYSTAPIQGNYQCN